MNFWAYLTTIEAPRYILSAFNFRWGTTLWNFLRQEYSNFIHRTQLFVIQYRIAVNGCIFNEWQNWSICVPLAGAGFFFFGSTTVRRFPFEIVSTCRVATVWLLHRKVLGLIRGSSDVNYGLMDCGVWNWIDRIVS